MNTKRKEFNFLLDNLKIAANKYCFNDNGIVVNANNEEIKDENIVINMRFYMSYCIAYKPIAEEIDNYAITDINQAYINRVLSDYNVFNSFIINCIYEYSMYKEIGTGYILYYPYNSLSDYFFKNIKRKTVLMDYLTSELSDIFVKDAKGVKI